jgi:putative flippase GtrA
VLKVIRHIVLSIIDFFHRPFERYINKQTFRYLACGGSNAVLNLVLYALSFNYVLDYIVKKQGLVRSTLDMETTKRLYLSFGSLHVTPHVAAFAISFVITFPIGFILSRYIVFPESALRGRVQLVRYLILVAFCIVLNYFFIKLFVEAFHIYPSIANIFTNILVAVFSYIAQRSFTFKVKKPKKA